jgi:CRP/FNR family cyclic AMP-dependent transcriptional regulator
VELAHRLADALYTSADAMVLRRLVVLCEAYGQGDAEVVIPLTQEDLAELAGVSRPTVNRVLQKEAQRGTLRITRGAVTILNCDELAQRVI